MSGIIARIGLLIEALQISRKDFAAKIERSPSNISNWFMGRSNPSKSSIKKICQEFNVNPAWLCGDQGEMFKDNPGYRLRKARFHLNLLQSDIGDKTEQPHQVIKNIETGKAELSSDLADSLYHKIGINPDWLLNGQGEMLKEIPPEEASEPPVTRDWVQRAIDRAIKDQKLKFANPTGKGIEKPLVRVASCGTPTRIAYDTGECVTIDSQYEYIDMVVEVEGESMEEYYIPSGARVYIKNQPDCYPGQIVLICNNDDPEEPKLILKKAKYNGNKIIFTNGQGREVPLGEKIEIVGVVEHIMIDAKKLKK